MKTISHTKVKETTLLSQKVRLGSITKKKLKIHLNNHAELEVSSHYIQIMKEKRAIELKCYPCNYLLICSKLFQPGSGSVSICIGAL